MRPELEREGMSQRGLGSRRVELGDFWAGVGGDKDSSQHYANRGEPGL